MEASNARILFHCYSDPTTSRQPEPESPATRKGPCFVRPDRAAGQDVLLRSSMTRQTAIKMIKRRSREAGLPGEISNHSFRGTGITEYLRNGGDLEIAARIAGHESTRTTQLYNLVHEELSLDEIERIHI